MNRLGAIGLLTTLLVLAAHATDAHAQAEILPDDATLAGAGDDDVEGWNPSLAGTATVNVVSNSNVVGQVDGFSTLFGLGVVGGADYVKDKHLVRLTLGVTESFARTPVLDELVKTNDVVAIEGLYNYFLRKRFGLFGRMSVGTSLFPATDVRAEPTSWVETQPGGMSVPLNTNATRQRLAGSFAPITISQSAGAFAAPINKERLSITARAGLGGRQTLADSVLVIDDDDATAPVELLRLSDVYQAGFEAFAGATGKLDDGKLTYKAGVSLLLPALNNDEFDRGIGALARVGLEGNLSFNVYDWMSLVYSLSVIRDPQLFPEGNELTQVQNNLLLTFKYTLVERKKKDKAPTAAEQELAAAKARAELAEAKAKELEVKLQAADAACAERCPAPAAAPDGAPAPTPSPSP